MRSWIIALIAFFSIPWLFAQSEKEGIHTPKLTKVVYGERILKFESLVKVLLDGSLLVHETITVNAEGEQIKRGIFRDFPQEYRNKLGFKKAKPFEVVEVKRNGRSEQFSISKIGTGTRVKMGDPGKMLERGQHAFELIYKTSDNLLYFDDSDELYWNVTGNYWEFPIDKVRATIELPNGLNVLHLDAYTGKIGSKEQKAKTAFFANTATANAENFSIGEGLTVSLVWPSGKLDEIAYERATLWYSFKENPLTIIAILILFGSLVLSFFNWHKVGRDPKKGIIIPRYEPPEGFGPAELRCLRKGAIDDTSISATVINFAANKLLRIEKKRKYYHLKRLKKPVEETALSPNEKEAFHSLVKGSKDKIVLSQKQGVKIRRMRARLFKSLRKLRSKHFNSNRKEFWTGTLLSLVALILWLYAIDHLFLLLVLLFILLPGVFFYIGLQMLLHGWKSKGFEALFFSVIPIGVSTFFIFKLTTIFLVDLGWLTWTFLGIVILSTIIFSFLMKAPTKQARKILDEIEGFEQYLKVAEEERLNLENPPERTPELFEKFLPYALALDLDQKWSEKFEDVLMKAAEDQKSKQSVAYSPSFYSGPEFHSSSFSKAASAAMGAAVTGALAEAATRPSASGSSYGSSSGGGSSGGGSGGGGGGGW